jgi:hypothetical protein
MYSFQVFIHLKINISENDSNWSKFWNEPIWSKSFSEFDLKFSDKIEYLTLYIEFVNIEFIFNNELLNFISEILI